MSQADSDARRRYWQIAMIVTMLVGYSGYYLCRNTWAQSKAAFEGDPSIGLTTTALGQIGSMGLLFYGLGKLINGTLGDFLGGRRMFLFGMVGSSAVTVAFGLSTGFWAFLTLVSINRLIQSMGWGAMVKMTSRWFSADEYATVMGYLSLSFLAGSAVSKWFLGWVIQLDVGTGVFGWRGMSIAAGAVLLAIAVVASFFLRESPRDVGLDEPAINPNNVYAQGGNAHAPLGLLDLWGPILSSGRFWVVCLLSVTLTVIRETFNSWTPLYLKTITGLDNQWSAWASSAFDLAGAASVVVCGLLADRLARGRRALLMTVFLLPAAPALYTLSLLGAGSDWRLATGLVALISFMILGPYSFLAGAYALDFGGRRGSAAAAGMIDACGYLCGMLIAELQVGSLVQKQGWSAAFLMLAALMGFTILVTSAFSIVEARAARGIQ